MLVVNLYGGPGAGKSTCAAYVFSKLKMIGVNCELVTEFAKQLVWEERTKTFTDQLYIFAKQHHKLHILKDSVDVAIVDSPLLLNLVYGCTNDCPVCFDDLVIHMNNSFESLNFFIHRVQHYQPIGRMQPPEGADKIAKEVLSMLKSMHPMVFTQVEGNPKGYDHIFKTTLDYCLSRY